MMKARCTSADRGGKTGVPVGWRCCLLDPLGSQGPPTGGPSGPTMKVEVDAGESRALRCRKGEASTQTESLCRVW